MSVFTWWFSDEDSLQILALLFFFYNKDISKLDNKIRLAV